jgi:hypothetical protein
MSVQRNVTADFVDSTAIVVSTTVAEVMSVKAQANPSSLAVDAYIQLFDSVAATPGTDAPLMVIPVPAYSRNGRTEEVSVHFAQGVLFTTGINMFVAAIPATTTTATTGTAVPGSVSVFFNRYG